MNNLRQAAQQALEAWFRPHGINYVDFRPYMEALKQALAEPQTTHWEGCEAVHPECRKPEQEPDGISWLKRDSGYFTAPTPRKPLTDKEIEVAAKSVPAAVYELMYGHEITVEKFRAALAEFARAIERAHGIGEQHGS